MTKFNFQDNTNRKNIKPIGIPMVVCKICEHCIQEKTRYFRSLMNRKTIKINDFVVSFNTAL